MATGTWSYDPSLATTRDWVRLKLGDTDMTDKQFVNEEIDAVLADVGNKYLAAAELAESLAGKYSRNVDKTVGRLSIKSSARGQQYAMLAKRLRAEIGRHVAPYAGGISESDMATVRDDTDRPMPDAERAIHDMPDTGGKVTVDWVD